MARRTKNPFVSDVVEAIAAGVAVDPTSATGETFVRMGTVWRTDHWIVQNFPHWFVDLGAGQTSLTHTVPREA
jgi:hypothetical protein